MWNEHLTNDTLMRAVLAGDLDGAKMALAAGASVMWSLPRQRCSFLQLAIRLHSVTFVNLLIANGAKVGLAELGTLVKEVGHTARQSTGDVRRLRGVAATLHKHGVNFDSHIDALAEHRPEWFRGLQAHYHHHRAQPSVVLGAPG